MNETDFIWADSDVIALQPFMPKDGYLIGFEDKHSINNAVMRLPTTSEALGFLTQATSDGATVPEWMKDDVDASIANAPYADVITAVSAKKINAYGPLALTWALKQTGEDRHALKRRFLSPLPWKFNDVAFNPGGGMDHWMSADTLAIHLFGSRVRHRHKLDGPPKGSFLFNVKTLVEAELGINSA